jgi:hypothetical protein
MQNIDSIDLNACEISSLYELNGVIVAGCRLGNVKIVKIQYPGE